MPRGQGLDAVEKEWQSTEASDKMQAMFMVGCGHGGTGPSRVETGTCGVVFALSSGSGIFGTFDEPSTFIRLALGFGNDGGEVASRLRRGSS